jgi:hypothetical protein
VAQARQAFPFEFFRRAFRSRHSARRASMLPRADELASSLGSGRRQFDRKTVSAEPVIPPERGRRGTAVGSGFPDAEADDEAAHYTTHDTLPPALVAEPTGESGRGGRRAARGSALAVTEAKAAMAEGRHNITINANSPELARQTSGLSRTGQPDAGPWDGTFIDICGRWLRCAGIAQGGKFRPPK